MLDRGAIQPLIARRDGTIASWCTEHRVTEEALAFAAGVYGHDEASVGAVIEAFRPGFEAAEDREP